MRQQPGTVSTTSQPAGAKLRPAMSIHCPNDGTRHPRVAKFCMRCGAALRSEVVPDRLAYVSRSRMWPKPALRGERHPRARLTTTTVRAIRSRYARGGVTQKQLAGEYGVSAGTISQIVTRRIWEHVG